MIANNMMLETNQPSGVVCILLRWSYCDIARKWLHSSMRASELVQHMLDHLMHAMYYDSVLVWNRLSSPQIWEALIIAWYDMTVIVLLYPACKLTRVVFAVFTLAVNTF